MFASQNLKDDIEIIDIAIQKNPFSLFNLSKENQENEKFALQSLKKDYKVYDFLPEQMKQEKDFLLEILKFRHIPISKIPKNLRFDHDILLLIVKSNLIIEHHHYLNLDFLKQAIQSNQGSLIFAPLDMQNDKKFILNLVKNSKSMYCIPYQFHKDQEILWILNCHKPIREINQFENLNFKFR